MKTVKKKIGIIGITGSFGSGKTTVAKTFRRLLKRNIKILDADRIARNIMKNSKIKSRIKREFGTTDRKKIANIIFDDRKKLIRLNKIIHPLVISKIKKEIKKQKNKIIIIDMPLLVETKMNKIADTVIIVKCKREIQIKRLMGKGFKRSEIIKRIKSQLPLKEKIKYADYVIDNNGHLKDTEKRVRKIISKIIMVK